MQRAELVDLLSRLTAGLGEMQLVEAKRARHEMPSDLLETVSAFSNTSDGGVILLGVDEDAGFTVSGVDDVERVSARVGQACRDELEPAVAPRLSSEEIDGLKVLVVEIPELRAGEKPCYIKSRGLVNGAFVRVGGTNRKLTSYETALMLANRGQPRNDVAVAVGATVDDLDANLVATLVARVRTRRGPAFQAVDDSTILERLNVTTPEGEVTLAGLLALGRYPQQRYPQLDVTFTAFAQSNRAPGPDGVRSQDSASVDGPMPTVLAETLRLIRKNMRYRAVVQGGGRLDVPDYPEAALREAIANALMHRDYSEPAHGTQIRVEMYPDRIEIESPGGLYGPVSTETLLAGDSMSSSRNAALAKLLEDVVGDDGQAIAENRGTGIAAMQRALRDSDLAPLELDDQIRRFVVRFRNATLIDEGTLGWIAGLGQLRLSQGQVAALALARRGATLTNARYRAVAGCDTATATRELRDLRDRGVLTKTGAGQRVAWMLSPALTSVPSSEIGLPGRFTSEIRRQQIRRLLELGDRSSRELSDATGLTKQSVRNYLNDLRSAGIVEPTSERIRSPATRWRLTQRFDRETG